MTDSNAHSSYWNNYSANVHLESPHSYLRATPTTWVKLDRARQDSIIYEFNLSPG
jgi:hypothetical protein